MSGNDMGSAWKEKREKMGKNLDEVSNTLRIGHRYLRGIEECNFEGWPEKVFSTGFIRTYAKYLSVDPSPVLDAYEKTLKKPPQEEEEVIRPEWMERGNRKTPYVFITVAVFIIGVALAFFTMRKTESPERFTGESKTENAAQINSASGDDVSASEPKVTASAVDNVVAAKDEAKTNIAAKTAPATVAPPPPKPPPAAPASVPPATPPPPKPPPAAPASVPPATPSPATPSSAATANAPPAASSPAKVSITGRNVSVAGPFELILEASEHTWLTYNLDGGDLIEVTLQTADKISIKAEKALTVRLGNAGGVIGTLNGQRLPPFGESGRVRTMNFGR
ncbi:MAG: DUF4115 domain-containing protein [Syntrophorhabdaceae bacterium]|nr:DUF4115 domain-containing protein [Syntrophorhabdaceae bacterium]